jgi:hypothetical protein
MAQRIDKWFVASALVFAIAGLVIAAHMGQSRDTSQMFVHAHLLVAGFLMSSVYGLCYRSWPVLKAGWFPLVHFAAHMLGAASLAVSLHLFAKGRGGVPAVPMVISATVLLIVAAIAFLVVFLRKAD